MSGVLDLFPEMPHLAPGSEQDERYTPRVVFEPLHREFRFTLDVCATAESAKVPRYFSQEQDGLKQSWAGERCWANVPFSDIEPWVVKAWESRAELVAMLVPQNRAEQPWWQTHVEPYRPDRGGHGLTARFLPTRIRFGHPGNPEGLGVGSPPFGCVLLVFAGERLFSPLMSLNGRH